jgi:hypothetical protein
MNQFDAAKEEATLRAAVYFNFPHILDELRATLFQLKSVARTYSTSRNYEVTFQALRAIADLTARYLHARNGNLIMPPSLSFFLGDRAPKHDTFLEEQLEGISDIAKIGFKADDVELLAEIVQTFLFLARHGLEINTLFETPGENNIANFVLFYLKTTAEEASVKKLDDIVLNCCRSLGAIGKGATVKELYSTHLIVVGYLETLASLATAQRKTYILREAIKAIVEMMWTAAGVGLTSTHTIRHDLDTLKRITIQEVSIAASTGLSASMDVQASLGPFLDLATNTAIGRLESELIQGLVSAIQRGDDKKAAEALDALRELNDQLWLLFADIGTAAAKRDSFALHFIDANISEIANQQLNLFQFLQENDIPGKDQWRKTDFLKQLIHDFSWLVGAVYWRIYDAFVPPVKSQFVRQFCGTLSQIGIRCTELDLTEGADRAIGNLKSIAMKAINVQLDGGYTPPRLAEHIARIGIIARKHGREQILQTAVKALREFQKAYVTKVEPIKELHGRLIYEIRDLDRERHATNWFIDHDSAYFFSRVGSEDIEQFVALLEAE